MIFEEHKNKYPLFVDAANYLEEHAYFFRNTLEKIKQNDLDYELAENLCRHAYNSVNNSREEYHKLVHTLIDFSIEFLRLQVHLEKTGRYTYSTYKEVLENVYNDPNRKLSGPWYTWALYFSQIFWVTHWNVMKFFLSEYAKTSKKNSEVLEVPTGTGIFLSLLLDRNPHMRGTGVDLEDSAIAFTKDVLQWYGVADRTQVIKEDVYKYETAKRFDYIMCGEFLEHVEDPLGVLTKVHSLLKDDGRVFITVAVYAEMIDHIYLYNNAEEVREHIHKAGFVVEKELVQSVFDKGKPTDSHTPINYCAILRRA